MKKHHSRARRILPVWTENKYFVDALVLGEVKRLTPRAVLDVGCGDGRFARELPGTRVVGVEVNAAVAASAEKVCGSVVVGDIERLETLGAAAAQGPYDAILAVDVIEHLVDPRAALARWHSLLGRQGRVVLNVPNLLYYRERVRLLRGQFEMSDSGGLYDSTHLHFFSLDELLNTLEAAELLPERVVAAANVRAGRRIGCSAPPIRVTHAVVSAAAHAVAQRRPGLLGRSFVVVACPKSGRQ